MKTIFLDGKEYRLVPLEEKGVSRAFGGPTEDILSDYRVEEKKEETGTRKAVGKVSDYRERFKKRKIMPQELIVQNRLRPNLVRQDGELDKFGGLFFGPGLEAEY